MRQILHIFAKDSRRFWPEIAVSLAILVAFVRVYPVQWMGPELFGSADDVERYRRLQGIAGTLALLLPVSWLSLIARVVHGESLVGDRQFWSLAFALELRRETLGFTALCVVETTERQGTVSHCVFWYAVFSGADCFACGGRVRFFRVCAWGVV